MGDSHEFPRLFRRPADTERITAMQPAIIRTSLQQNPPVVTPPGAITGEAFGATTLSINLKPLGIASQEAAGTKILQSGINPAGIGTQEIFGAPGASMNILPGGITPKERFGTPDIYILQPSPPERTLNPAIQSRIFVPRSQNRIL